MKKRIYLTRHGEAGPVEGRTICCGRHPDEPLNENGRRQAEQLAPCLDGILTEQIVCSTQRRSRETGYILSGGKIPLLQRDDLCEMGMGVWEGMNFDEIRRRYPALYEGRALDHSLQPPGGESYEAASRRMQSAVKQILEATEAQEEVVITSHCSSNRALLCSLLGIPFSENRNLPQPHACINVLEVSEDGIRPLAVGMAPDALPDEKEIRDLLEQFQVSSEIREHTEAVAELAMELYEPLKQAGICLNREVVRCCALLHDMCRSQRHHEKAAAMELRKRGYLLAARVIELHHGGAFSRRFDEAQLLFLADKMVDGARRVTIEERFARSAEKCKSPQAVAAHAGRLLQTRQIDREYQGLIYGIIRQAEGKGKEQEVS